MASFARLSRLMGQIALSCGQKHDHSPSMNEDELVDKRGRGGDRRR
jgi:hypothetical protein